MNITLNPWAAAAFFGLLAGSVSTAFLFHSCGTNPDCPESTIFQQETLLLPVPPQLWNLKGRGLVLVWEVDEKNREITYHLKNNEGNWQGQHSVTTDLDRFMAYAKLAPYKTAVSTAYKEAEPLIGQLWNLDGYGQVQVKDVIHPEEGESLVRYSLGRLHSATQPLDLFMKHADVASGQKFRESECPGEGEE